MISELSQELTGGSFNKLEPARIGFVSDELSGETTISIKGVVGIDLLQGLKGDKKPFTLLPFLSYELSDTDSPSGTDVHQLTPGIIVSKRANVDLGEFGFGDRISVLVLGTKDFEQDAETVRLQAAWDFNPYWNVGPGDRRRLCYSDNVLGNSPLKYHCTAQTLIEITHVADAGTSADLIEDDDDEFVGIGGSIGLTLFTALDDDRWFFLNNFSLSVSYRYVGIVSGALENQNRFVAALAYKPSGMRNTELALSYTKGEVVETFQEEERVRLTIGFRF